MQQKNVDDINISQLCHALVAEDKDGNEIFVNICPHRVALDMFDGGEPVVVEVHRVEDKDKSRYWAWFKYFSQQPYVFICPSRDETINCIPNYEERQMNKEGRLVNVVVERWRSF